MCVHAGGVYEEHDQEYNLREKFQIVVYVARVVQNRLSRYGRGGGGGGF